MRIGYDISSINGQPSGVGYYTLHLLRHMAEVEPDHEYLLFSNHASPALEQLSQPPFAQALSSFPNRMVWMQCLLPRVVRSLAPHVCHYPNSIGPLRSPCPYIVTIHDMTLSLLPQYHPWRKQLLVRPLIPLFARRARTIITGSESARADIVRLLRVSPEQVVVVPYAAAPHFQPADEREQQRVRGRYGLHRPYLLYVGTLEPRKNIVRLIRAWHGLRRRGAIEHQLVIVGAAGWQYQPIYREVARLGCADDIRFTGYVPREDLPALYSAADAFAFPSLYEGFGLPVIEAMACGTAVLTSSTPALAEVAGDAALQVDASRTEEIAAGLERLLTDGALREALRAQGLRRAAHFSWRRAAEQTMEVYRQVPARPLRLSEGLPAESTEGVSSFKC